MKIGILRLLVGSMEDGDAPVVVSTVDEELYSNGGTDVWDPEKIKTEWPPEYEWREVLLHYDAQQLADLFKTHETRAILKEAKP